jgi:hypothetical protein
MALPPRVCDEDEDGCGSKKQRLRAALQILQQTSPITGTIGERYLRDGRLITLDPLPVDVRFHPGLAHHPTKTRWPAIVLSVRNHQNSICGIWRNYLASDGKGKAPITPTRMALGAIMGGAVRLGQPARGLTIGEGLETCLSAMSARPERPAWCGLSASLLPHIMLPAGVIDVLVLEDADEPDERGYRAGPQAVARLALRLRSEGRQVRIARPPAGFNDMNDLLRAPAPGGA